MARSIKGITIEIEGKTSGLVKSLNDANKAIKDTEASLRQVNKALKLDPGNADLIKAKQNALATEIEATKQKLEAEKKAAEDAAEALEKGAITQGEYDALQADIALTTDKLKGLEDEAKKSSSVLGQQMQVAGGKISEVGDKISGVGQALLPVTGALAGVAAGALKAFDEVDGAYDTLITKTGAAGSALEGLQKVVDDIATTMPTSFDEAANAVGEVNTRFGLIGDDLQSLSEQFIKFAKINGTDVSSSVDKVQKGLAAFGMDASQAGEYLDTLNAVGQQTGVNIDTLSQNLISAAPALTELGLTATQAAHFLGEVEVSGADTSAVMTGLRTALKNATKDGMSLDDALAQMQASMESASSDAEGLQAAYDTFGTKAGAAIYKAVKNGTLSFEDLAKTAQSSLGSVSETFEGTVDGIDSTAMAMNSLKLAGAEVGATIGETLAPIIERVAQVLRDFAEAWRGLSPEVQKTIVVVGGLVAALGPVLMIIGKVVSAVGTVVSAIGAALPVITAIATAVGGFIATALVPILPIIAAVGAAIAAVIVVIKNWDSIVELAGMVFEEFRDLLLKAGNAIKTGLSNAFKAAGNAIKGVFNNLKTWASNVRTALVQTFTALGDAIKARATGIGTAVVEGVSKAVNFIKELPSKAYTWGTDMIDSFINGIKKKIANLQEALRGAAQKVKDFLGFSEPKEGPLSNFHTFAPDMMDLFAKGIKDSTSVVTQALQASANQTASAVQTDYTGVLRQIATNTGATSANTGRATGDINIALKVGSQQFGRAVLKAGQLNAYRTGGH